MTSLTRSIHHLTDAQMSELFRKGHRILTDDGVFIDPVPVLGATPAIDRRFRETLLIQVKDRGVSNEDLNEPLSRMRKRVKWARWNPSQAGCRKPVPMRSIVSTKALGSWCIQAARRRKSPIDVCSRRPGAIEGKDLPTKKTNPDLNKLDRVVAEARLNQEERERGYRERALKMYPWVCGRCAREFTLKNVRELTVHHRDHNHDNNPADGSNWELLCVYCHDNKHQRYLTAELTGKDKAGARQDANTTFKAFAGLGDLLKRQN